MIYNNQLEQNVIGEILELNGLGEAVENALELLTVEDFYSHTHKLIFGVMAELYKSGVAPSASSVTAHHLIEDAEGDENCWLYINELWKGTTSAAGLNYHCAELRKTTELRKTQERVQAINEIISSSISVTDKLRDIEQLMTIESGFSDNHVGAKHIADCIPTYLDRLEQRWTNKDSIIFSTGLPDLDTILGGGFEVGLYAIGANPKMGKTELMAKMINHFGVDRQLPVYVGSLEMPDFQVIERLVSGYGKLDKTALKDGFMNESPSEQELSFSVHTKAVSDVGNSNIYIDDRHENTVRNIRRECLKIQKKHGRIGGIFVDYLTLLVSDGKHDRNDLAVAAMTRALKSMSKEFMCPVIMLLQLNRGNTNRPDKRPLASDSRESGAIEQDVDGWIGLYRDSVFNADSEWQNITEVIVRLNRHGETGTCYQLITGSGFKDADMQTVADIINKSQRGNKQPADEDIQWKHA